MKLRKRYTPPPGKDARHLQGERPVSGRAPAPRNATSDREKSEAPTLPPPALERMEKAERNRSGVRARRSQQPPPAATVDEVTADLSKDPRRED